MSFNNILLPWLSAGSKKEMTVSVWELDFTVTAGPSLNSVSEQLSFSFAFFHLHRNQCISQMKEVKEQCEERIQEVTRKGNEALPSWDLNEQKDQSQQVILGFFCQESPRGLPALSSGICCPVCSSSLRVSSLVPGCGVSDWVCWPLNPISVLQASFKAHSHLGEGCFCFPVLRAPRPVEVVKYCPKVSAPGQWWSWSKPRCQTAACVSTANGSAAHSLLGDLCFKYSHFIEIYFAYHRVIYVIFTVQWF